MCEPLFLVALSESGHLLSRKRTVLVSANDTTSPACEREHRAQQVPGAGHCSTQKNRTSFGDGIYCSVGWLLCGSGATVAKDGPLSRPMSRACVGRSNVLQPFILREDELLDVLCRALELEKFAVALVKTAHLIGA